MTEQMKTRAPEEIRNEHSLSNLVGPPAKILRVYAHTVLTVEEKNFSVSNVQTDFSKIRT